MIYLIAFVIVYFLHVLLKLNFYASLAIMLYALVMIPLHKRSFYLAKNNQQRFTELSLYLDTILYAFIKEEKVEAAVRDVSQTLPQGRLKELTLEVLELLNMTYEDKEIFEEALFLVEKEYPCKRLKDVHQFMTHVEYYGGEIEKPVNLLLTDKTRWERRIKTAMAERKKQMTDIILSVTVALIVSGAIVHLPIMNIDISNQMVVQICAVLVVICNDMIIYRAQKFQEVDWIGIRLTEDEAYYVQKIQAYYAYDEKKNHRLSIILGSIAAVIALVLYWFADPWVTAAALFVMIFFFYQDRIGRHIERKNLIREIKYAFPNWLLDLVLLLQSENVQVALLKSQDHVPGVLKDALIRLNTDLEAEPESSAPYYQFLHGFEIPEVHSAMGILYSLSIGNSGNADKQISELVEKNMELLDMAESELLRNAMAGMYVLFMLPVLTASFKLIVDMVFMMLQFVRLPII